MTHGGLLPCGKYYLFNNLIPEAIKYYYNGERPHRSFMDSHVAYDQVAYDVVV
jgi:hypothetical protein